MRLIGGIVVNCVVIQEIVSILDHKLVFSHTPLFEYNLLFAFRCDDVVYQGLMDRKHPTSDSACLTIHVCLSVEVKILFIGMSCIPFLCCLISCNSNHGWIRVKYDTSRLRYVTRHTWRVNEKERNIKYDSCQDYGPPE